MEEESGIGLQDTLVPQARHPPDLKLRDTARIGICDEHHLSCEPREYPQLLHVRPSHFYVECEHGF